MGAKCEGVCPTELAESLMLVYGRFAGNAVLRKGIREKFGWEVFGGFTVIFQMFIATCRAKGHRRQTRRQLLGLLKTVTLPKTADLNAKAVAKKIGKLVSNESDLYREELLEKYSGSPNVSALKDVCVLADWRQIGIWLLTEGEHRQLERFAKLVPAFEWGFWK